MNFEGIDVCMMRDQPVERHWYSGIVSRKNICYCKIKPIWAPISHKHFQCWHLEEIMKWLVHKLTGLSHCASGRTAGKAKQDTPAAPDKVGFGYFLNRKWTLCSIHFNLTPPINLTPTPKSYISSRFYKIFSPSYIQQSGVRFHKTVSHWLIYITR